MLVPGPPYFELTTANFSTRQPICIELKAREWHLRLGAKIRLSSSS